jgi:ATP-dependent DNA ligase
MSGCTRSNTDGSRVKLYSRPGNDLTDRFPLIVEALAGCARGPASSTGKR